MSPKPADALAVGRVTGAYGVKGWIKVQPFSLHADALFANTTWWLSASAGAPRLQPLPESVKVVQLREQGDALVAQLEGVNDRNAAEALQGATLNVSRASFPKTDGDDEFYWVDLIGLDVVDRQGKALGQVVDLIDTGPHCVLRITLFPELVAAAACRIGITRRAFRPDQVDVRLLALARLHAEDNYRRVDDRPFGGGPGMVMLVEPLERALAPAHRGPLASPRRWCTSRPPAERLTQALVQPRWPPGRVRCCCAGATRASTSASSTAT
jgi:16S rRNA processing protein RimM